MALLTNIKQSWIVRGRHWFSLGQLAIAAVLLSAALIGRAQTAPLKQYEVKAIFLFNFAQFVDWPTNAFNDAKSPMIIGVLGDDPFGSYLDETVRGEKVNGHPLVIQRYSHAEDIKECHILFISSSENRRLEHNFAVLNDRSILTVGEMEGFSQRGGMIRFVTEKNKIRLHINLEAARTENLTISSRLLRLADIVGPGKD